MSDYTDVLQERLNIIYNLYKNGNYSEEQKQALKFVGASIAKEIKLFKRVEFVNTEVSKYLVMLQKLEEASTVRH